MIAKVARFLAYAVLAFVLLGIGSLQSFARQPSFPESDDLIASISPADAPWSPPTAISDLTKWSNLASIAATPDGDICVFYHEFEHDINHNPINHILRSRCRPTGGIWGAAETIYAAPTGVNIGDLSTAMNAAGDMYAAWTENRNDTGYDVFFAYHPADASWSSSTQVNDLAQGSVYPWAGNIALAVDGEDRVHLLWLGDPANSSTYFVYHSVRAPAGTWAASERVSDVSSRYHPAIVVDNEGNVYAVFNGNSSGTFRVWFDYHPAGGTWGVDQQIERVPDTRGAGTLSMASDDSHRLYIVYNDWSTSPISAKMISRGADGAWSAPETVATALGAQILTLTPAVTANWHGDSYVVWGSDGMEPSSVGTHVYFKLRPFGDTWQPQETVWTPSVHGSNTFPDITLDGVGNVHVAWSTQDDAIDREVVYYASRPAPVMPIQCQTQETLSFTQYYGLATLTDGTPAPVGTIVRAYNPRGDEVGCMTTTTANRYGYLRVYGEDASVNPPIPGMRSGEQVAFKVNQDSALSDPATVSWQDDKLAHQVHLGQAWSQWYAWSPGWNLFSTAVRPPDTAPGAVLNSATGKYDLVLGQSGTYAPPPADPTYNTLNELTYGKAYWIRMTAGSVISPNISGFTVAVTTPLSLGTSWRWVGYLPRVTLPVATALASIAGKYDRVVGPTGSYEPPPADPRFNTLTEMKPGEGYLIHMTSAGTLTYPADSTVQAQSLYAASGLEGVCPGVAVTPYFTEYYGALQVDGVDAPAGTVVKARNLRGDLVGCGATAYSGVYGYLRVYGEDATAVPAIPGVRSGESVTFSVDGAQLTTVQGSVAWSDDKAHHQVGLTALNAPAAVTGLRIQVSAASIQLDWSAVGGVIDTYEVWRGTQPYFTPGDAGYNCVKLGDTAGLSWLDSDAGPVDVIGDVNINYFYAIRAVNLAGPSVIGQRTGEFDFALAPGATQ